MYFVEVSHDQLSLEESAFDTGKSSYLVLVKEGLGGDERRTIETAALRLDNCVDSIM